MDTVQVDRSTCVGHGLCYGVAPEVLGSDANGDPVVLVDPVPSELSALARRAVARCPERALTLVPQHEVPSPVSPERVEDRAFEVVLEGRADVADGVVTLTLRPADGGPFPAWTPGAHLDLVLGEGLVRQYSLCGDPEDTATAQVAVLKEPESRGGSRHVHEQLHAGDRLLLRGPRNHFPLVPSERYLFIAGGIGITPFLPMIKEVDARGADWSLAYGGRTRASMAFADELAATYGGRVQIFPQDEVGLLDLASLLGHPEPGTQVYCCGPEPLLAAVEAGCSTWPARSLHVERFAPKPQEHVGPDQPFTVVLGRAGKSVEVPVGTTIVAALATIDVDVTTSCAEGTCGTCETRVLAGTPDHRDSLLSDEERAGNDTMMLCVSRSCSPTLTLDL